MNTNELNLKDKKFGKLIAIESLRREKYGYIWKCKCECGNFCERLATKLNLGLTTSCGCALKREGKYNWSGYKDITGFFWACLLANAKTRKIKVDITIQDAWNQYIKQNKKCVLTDEILIFSSKWNLRDGNASLDRIDSTKGYAKDNIQWVHKVINKMKMNMSDKDLIKWAEKIVNKNKLTNL